MHSERGNNALIETCGKTTRQEEERKQKTDIQRFFKKIIGKGN